MYESYRIYNTFWFPFCQDESSYPWSCYSYAACILYMPVWSLCARLPPPLKFSLLLFGHSSIIRFSRPALPQNVILSIKKRPKLFHSPNYYIIWVRIRQSFFAKNYWFIKFFKYTTTRKKLQAGKTLEFPQFCPQKHHYCLYLYTTLKKCPKYKESYPFLM